MEDSHTGGLIGLAIAGLFAGGKLLELVRIYVEKKRREPLIRQADIDRKENTKELRRLADKLARLEGWKEGATGEYKIPPRHP